MKKVILGNLSFNVELTSNDRRKFSVEVTGRRSILVSAPPEARWIDVRERILKKEKWILRRESALQDLPLLIPQRKVETGEGFYLLGHQYRIRVESGVNDVLLRGNEILITCDSESMAKDVLADWLIDYTNDYLEDVFINCLQKFQLKLDCSVTPRLMIKKMKRRWGSCSPNNLITLNTELIAAHPKCIEYVIYHELCHTIHLDHSKDFYNALERMIPNYEEQKYKLDTTTQLTEL